MNNLKAKLLEKLEDFLVKFLNESKAVDSATTESPKIGNLPAPVPLESPDGNVNTVRFLFSLSSFE